MGSGSGSRSVILKKKNSDSPPNINHSLYFFFFFRIAEIETTKWSCYPKMLELLRVHIFGLMRFMNFTMLIFPPQQFYYRIKPGDNQSVIAAGFAILWTCQHRESYYYFAFCFVNVAVSFCFYSFFYFIIIDYMLTLPRKVIKMCPCICVVVILFFSCKISAIKL